MNPQTAIDRSWIQTFTGKKFYPLDPDPELICLEDIAHSLACQGRYAGHARQFYSVAQHSVHLAEVIMDRHPLSDRFRLAKYALLHDASEAYLTDIPAPLKHRPEFAFYRDAEDLLQRLIFRKFGLAGDGSAEVREMDKQMVAEEAAIYMSPQHHDWPYQRVQGWLDGSYGWTWHHAELRFHETFERITTKLETA